MIESSRTVGLLLTLNVVHFAYKALVVISRMLFHIVFLLLNSSEVLHSFLSFCHRLTGCTVTYIFDVDLHQYVVFDAVLLHGHVQMNAFSYLKFIHSFHYAFMIMKSLSLTCDHKGISLKIPILILNIYSSSKARFSQEVTSFKDQLRFCLRQIKYKIMKTRLETLNLQK